MKKITLILLLTWVLGGRVAGQYAWNNVGLGTNLAVHSLTADNANNVLYVGGIFTQAGALPTVGIAQWDGSSYSPVGLSLITGTGVFSMIMDNTNLIVGGNFTNIGGTIAKNIAVWNGAVWAPFGSGLDSSTAGFSIINALCMYKNQLYAGGIFNNSGGSPLSNIARWDGANWQPLGTGVNGVVRSLCVYKNELYVGGTFTDAGGVLVRNIAKWDSTSWGDVGGGVNYTGAISVSALQVYNGDLYAGGTFDTAGTIAVNHIARWDSTNWGDVGGGASNYTGAISVSAFTLYHGELVAGGAFDSLGGTISAKNIGSWNGTNWTTFGTGVNSSVYALAALSDTLYAGGLFTVAGGIPSPFIAQWQVSPTAAVTGSNEITGGKFDIFPNPAGNKIFILLNDKRTLNDEFGFSLHNALGNEVAPPTNFRERMVINRNGLAAGMYFYKITGKDGTVMQQGRVVFTD